jgi:(p)ppGpp synthase/HD superfamily hydrolase
MEYYLNISYLDDFKGYDKRRVKPGINVFKEDGTELGWNYEHDTRFYEDADAVSTQNKEDEKTVETLSGKVEEIITKSGQKIISRGRGSKKFIAALLDSDSD